MIWLVGLGAAALLGALLYWLIIIGEGTYLGPWAVRLIYHLGAGVYDRVHAPVTASDAMYLLGPLRTALAEEPEGRVLDIATGTGRLPLLLARQQWFTGHIEALDFSQAMLQRAEAKITGEYFDDRITLHHGDACHLSWDDAFFALVTCLEALEYFATPQHAIREMMRVLRPHGTLIISVWPQAAARWLPGKALDSERMVAFLQAHGCCEVEVQPWQPGYYDLVIARKC